MTTRLEHVKDRLAWWIDAADQERRRADRAEEALKPFADFAVWCSQQDYRGPMPEFVRRACDLLVDHPR